MTTFTTRYGFPQIVEATDLVNVATDFNTPWATLDTLLGSQVCTSTTRPASPVQGQLIFETNTGIVRIWTGAAWENTGIVACLSSAFPANPIAGDTVYTTDKNAMASYTGSAWKFTTTVVCTSTTRPAVALASGVSIWETDTLAYAEYSGSAWRYTTNLTCTSSTRPTGSNTALVNGTLATETDTERVIQWTGSAWLPLSMTICTAATHPANPLTGSEIYETDTGLSAVYTSGAAYYYPPQRIATTTLAVAAATISFPATIPQVFKHLAIEVDVKSLATATSYVTDSLYVQFNGITSAEYNTTSLFTTSGGTPSSGMATAKTYAQLSPVWNAFGSNTPGSGRSHYEINNYTGTVFCKSCQGIMYASDGGAVSSLHMVGAALSAGTSTAAITSLLFGLVSGANMAIGSTITLYGW